jgi:hypothetical protein
MQAADSLRELFHGPFDSETRSDFLYGSRLHRRLGNAELSHPLL